MKEIDEAADLNIKYNIVLDKLNGNNEQKKVIVPTIEQAEKFDDFVAAIQGINTTPGTKFYKQLGSYVQSMKNLKYPMTNKKTLKDDMSTFDAFITFLKTVDENGKSNYQQILEDGQRIDPESENKKIIDDGLKAFSDYYELEVNFDFLNSLIKQDNTVEVQDKAVDTYDKLIAATKIKGTIFDFDSDNKKVFDNMQKTLNRVYDILSDEVEDAQNQIIKDSNNDIETKKKLADEIKKYTTAFSTIQKTSYVDIAKEDFEDALKTIKGFEDFLKDGEGVTNFTRIKDICSKNNIKSSGLEFGIKALEGTLHLGINLDRINTAVAKAKAKAPEAEIKEEVNNASVWIKKLRKPLVDNPATARMEPDYPKKLIARIMAARYIANSDRGYSDKLIDTNTTMSEIDKTADMLLDDPLFNNFVGTISDSKALLSKAESAIKKGHGGGLDDMFKDHLANQNAAELNTTPMLERYLPSTLTRIDALKKQAESIISKGYVPKYVMAEILILRNTIDAERDYKSCLKKPVPVNGKELRKKVMALAGNEDFEKICSDPKIKSLISSGHGGAMIDEMRKFIAKDENGITNENVKTIINEGTFKGRMNKLLNDAKESIKELNTVNNDRALAQDKNTKVSKAMELATEYLILSMHLQKNKKQDDKYSANIPWHEINPRKMDALANNDYKRIFGHGTDPAKAINILTKMTNENTSSLDFIDYTFKEMKAQKKKAENNNNPNTKVKVSFNGKSI